MGFVSSECDDERVASLATVLAAGCLAARCFAISVRRRYRMAVGFVVSTSAIVSVCSFFTGSLLLTEDSKPIVRFFDFLLKTCKPDALILLTPARIAVSLVGTSFDQPLNSVFSFSLKQREFLCR
eukprot:TRINITY_DN32368_c0_g1_i1.p1 TRINITY_DN32368_c0_g1~~TRINITY_DN32368_c0_g1_i1.p1  ORF type:complete len:125 (-),score=7.71 TRINITY_DN32368_c0_g1_i1:136-510(-)